MQQQGTTEASELTNTNERKVASFTAIAVEQQNEPSREVVAATLAELADDKPKPRDGSGTSAVDSSSDNDDNLDCIDLSKKCENGYTEIFPQRLREAIESTDAGEQSIVWSSDGMSFVIASPREFVHTILPKYFKQTKFASFTRKLNRWGFKRITKGPNAGAYFHKLFQRDKPKLCLKMVCQKVKTPRKRRGPAAAQQLHRNPTTLMVPGGMPSFVVGGASTSMPSLFAQPNLNTSSDLVHQIIRERAAAALSADQRLHFMQDQQRRTHFPSLLGNATGDIASQYESLVIGGGGSTAHNQLDLATLRRQMLLDNANRTHISSILYSSDPSRTASLLGSGLVERIGSGASGTAGVADNSLLATMERLRQQDMLERQLQALKGSTQQYTGSANRGANEDKASASTTNAALGETVKQKEQVARGA